jgi:hypothetical protein
MQRNKRNVFKNQADDGEEYERRIEREEDIDEMHQAEVAVLFIRSSWRIGDTEAAAAKCHNTYKGPVNTATLQGLNHALQGCL